MTVFEDLIIEREGAVATITLNRPEAGNKLRARTCREIVDVLTAIKLDRSLRTVVLTGTGDKFFCIGGEHDEMTGLDPSQVLPIIDVYQAIDTIPKPVIAAVNGFAVGGGNVLHNVCDLSVASSTAVFRQVGPMVGSFDAGYGSWYLEDSIGRKRAKQMWYLNEKFTAEQALAMGLVNEVVAPERLRSRAAEIAGEISCRSPLAIAAMKAAFSSRHNGVSGQARLAHDQYLTAYLVTKEAHEMRAAFNERRPPDPSRFWS
jgi:naphthoate synthase